MPTDKIYFAGFIIILLLLIFYLKPKTAEIKIGGKTFSAEVADNMLTRSRGLMYRAAPSPMIFIFPSPTSEGFWMKNVNFPLDIIWIDSEKRIIGTDRMETCFEKECKIYSPPGPIKFALEVKAGFVEKNKIKAGGEIEISSL
ncbi:MAG TPA: DUF192 domain-containing protein [archaeon]|nr:DUF192 domain-containing protein [archaeon]